jgi:hypothetical protein
MVNSNDPANIPYIITYPGGYYVAYKEKVKVPYVVVSAKGVANGLSEEYNDGWDFGPDSYNPDYTGSEIPYTQTSGIQEAWDYAFSPSSGGYLNKVVLTGGGKVYIDVPLSLRSTYGNIVFEGEGGDGYSQIQCSDNFTGNYLIEVAQQGFVRFSGIRLTPIMPNGTMINYGLYFNNSSSDSNQYWENFTFDAANVAQLYQNTTVNGRIFFKSVVFNGGGQYFFYTTNGNSLFQFIQCSPENTLYSVPSTGGASQLMFVECQTPAFHSRNTSVNLQSTYIWIGNSDMVFYGTAQIGNNVNIWGTNVRFSQFNSANYINIQGTDVNIYIRGGYSDYNGGGSGTFYLVTASTGASGYVTVEKVQLSNNSSGTTVSITNQSIVPVNVKDIFIQPSSGTVSIEYPTPTTPSVPASGTSQENTNPYPVDVYIYGGDVTEIQITRNGTAYTVLSVSTAIAMSGQVYKLNPGDSITVTYSTAPSWEWLSD